jgi:PEP-CTERM motif
MKKFIYVSLALGAALALNSTALADSFSYKSSGSGATGNPSQIAGPADFAIGVSANGASPFSFSPETSAMNQGTASNFGFANRLAVNAARGENGIATTGDGLFLFDNVLSSSDLRNGMLERGGVLVDVTGYQLNLFSGSFGGGNGTNAAGTKHSTSANKSGYLAGNGVVRGIAERVPSSSTLTETPEPGSLFLLGTGLLCMALVLFRKAAKQPSNES